MEENPLIPWTFRHPNLGILIMILQSHNIRSIVKSRLIGMILARYDIRRLAAARDPLAVIEAHRLNVCFRLAWLLGMRMCPRCPRCNEDGLWGCQDLFGSNMRPTGGILGGALAFEGGNENQASSTPHFHGQVHIVCM